MSISCVVSPQCTHIEYIKRQSQIQLCFYSCTLHQHQTIYHIRYTQTVNTVFHQNRSTVWLQPLASQIQIPRPPSFHHSDRVEYECGNTNTSCISIGKWNGLKVWYVREYPSFVDGRQYSSISPSPAKPSQTSHEHDRWLFSTVSFFCNGFYNRMNHCRHKSFL